jgi:hypothetical protein
METIVVDPNGETAGQVRRCIGGNAPAPADHLAGGPSQAGKVDGGATGAGAAAKGGAGGAGW